MTQPQQTPVTDARSAKAQAKADKAYRKASRPFYQKPWFIILAVIAVLTIIAVARSSGDDTSTSATTSADAGQGQAEQPAGGEPAEQPAGPSFAGQQDGDVSADAGAQIDLDGVAITSAPLVEADAYGTTVLCSTISIANNSDETVNFGSYDWNLQDPNGASRSFTITASETPLNSGDLVVGGTVSGDVCFDGDTAVAGTYVVLYEPTFSFSSDRAAWINNR